MLFENFNFYQTDIAYIKEMKTLWSQEQPLYVVHLAAQAGVRYSLKDPYLFFYVQSNLQGFTVVLECCRDQKEFSTFDLRKHFISLWSQ